MTSTVATPRLRRRTVSNQDNDQEQADRNSREQHMMWIFSAAIILLILGGMGANMLFHHPSPAESATDISSQSRTAPDK